MSDPTQRRPALSTLLGGVTQARSYGTLLTSPAMTLSVSAWDEKFSRWAVGPGQTEADKCDNAQRMIREAIREHTALRDRDITVFVQGSYRNRTNIRLESDVDVCVLCKNTFFSDYQHVPDVSDTSLGFDPATYSFADLKKDIEAALVAKFGRSGVTAGSKAFDVHENTYRVAADVVPTFEGRLYYRDYLGNLRYHSGTVLQCNESGKLIYNWPEQHYTEGVDKRNRTDKQFKKKARILKNLRNEMAAAGYPYAKKMSSFLLESLVFNADDSNFKFATHYDDMKAIIAQLWHKTKADESPLAMLEVNNIKYLFYWSQPWTRADAHGFIDEAWRYVGFTD